MSIYVVLKRRKEMGVSLPHFESYTSEPKLEDPNHKLLTLEPGDCVDVGRFSLTSAGIHVNQYRVSNIDGVLDERITESYTLPRYGGSLNEKNDCS